MHPAAKRKPVPARTVLLVDDNPSVRAGLRSLFLSDGFAVCVEAGNGVEAIELAQGCKPDVIVLDVVMPVMNGIDAAPKLKALLTSNQPNPHCLPGPSHSPIFFLLSDNDS